MKLQLKATRGGDGLEKESREHETTTRRNESGREISERKQGT